jgi:hypothetical protein
MSIEIMSKVWASSIHKGSSLLLLLAIADNANNDGGAFPGIDYLAHKVRMSRRQTQRLVQELDQSNELAVIWGGVGPKSSHYYYVLVGKSPEEISAIKQEFTKVNSDRKGYIPAHKLYPENQENNGDNLTPISQDHNEDDNLSPSGIRPKKDDKMAPSGRPFMGDKLSNKGDISRIKGVKNSNKGDIAVAHEPLINQERDNRQGKPGAREPLRSRNRIPAPAPKSPPQGAVNQGIKNEKLRMDPLPPEVQLYQHITGRIPPRDQWSIIIRAWKDKSMTSESLMPYWEAWVARDHKRTSLGWLDWVERGEIPEPWAKKPIVNQKENDLKGIQAIQKIMGEMGNGIL